MIPFRDSNPSGTKPVVTVAIIVANVVVFGYELALGRQLDAFVMHYGLIPALVTGGLPIEGFNWPDKAIRFVSTMFLHGGWLHLIGNMWYLWLFGDNIEDRLGHVRFGLFYLACGFAASLVHIASDPSSLVPTVGASGAIAGVLGAYMVTFPHARIATFVPTFFLPMVVELPAVLVLGFWFVTQLFNGTFTIALAAQTTGGVAWWAHIGGFVIGVMLIRVLPRRSKSRQSVYTVPYDRRYW